MGTDIELPPISEENLGPAMRALTPLQRRYVRAVALVGSRKHLRAARIAGYQGNDNVVSGVGLDLSRNPKVTAALVEEGYYTLQMGVTEALATIIEVARGEVLPKKAAVRLKACGMILDRAGLPMETRQNITVMHKSDSEAAMLTQLDALTKKNPGLLGQVPVPIQKMLEARKVKQEAIDADYTEVAAETIDPDADLLGG